jgi:ABC-type microcin C transport system duplicated ATPase subunit YejF
MRLLEPTAGRVLLGGTDVTELSESAMRRHRRDVQLIFQDPFASLNPRMTVGQILAEPLMLHGFVPRTGAPSLSRSASPGRAQARQAARFPHEFSGGQRQRIVIARALAVEARR